MKLKRVLVAGAAIILCGLSGTAQAGNDRLSILEINTFVANLTNAVNNPDPQIGRTFLQRNVHAGASFHSTLNSAWADARYYARPVWGDYHYMSPYYRYPYAQGMYVHPTSYAMESKTDMINQLEHKKMLIPNYHQSMDIVSTKMPADGSSATLDVRLKEFGMSYLMGPYGPEYGQQVEHADSRCTLQLTKEYKSVQITDMRCNTMLRMPY